MRKYVIVSKSELDDPDSTIHFSQLSYTDKTCLRYSLDGESAVISYETPIPSFFSGMDTYTYSQIQQILDGDEWTKTYTLEEVQAMM